MLIPENMEELSLSHWVEYQCNTSIENEKCLIALYLHFSPTWACSVCMQVG